MSCFPDPPRNLNDSEANVWFGGAFIERTNTRWSNNWHQFRAGKWAVFEHWGGYEFLYQTWNRIYRNWLSQTEYMLRDDIPFEAYLPHSDTSDRSKQLTRIYVPVKKA
jgi:predicted transcriptional regulator YdeE